MTLTDPEALFRCLKTATAGAAFGDQAVGSSPAGRSSAPCSWHWSASAQSRRARSANSAGRSCVNPSGVLLHEHRHQHLNERQQSLDQGAALGAHRVVRAQRLERVELRAQRCPVDRRHGRPGLHRQALRRQHQRDQHLTHPRRRLGTTLCVVHDPVRS